MNCQECNNEFTPINNRGAEQKYCSTKCRSKAGTKRREARLINQTINNEKHRSTRIEQSEIADSGVDRVGRGISEANQRRWDFTNSVLSNYKESRTSEGDFNRYATNGVQESHINLIRELYESRSESIFYKLKNEQLEKELSELKIEISQLEMELEDVDSNTPVGEYSGMLGGVMEQFKTDPVNTINFATDLIQTLFKPKP